MATSAYPGVGHQSTLAPCGLHHFRPLVGLGPQMLRERIGRGGNDEEPLVFELLLELGRSQQTRRFVVQPRARWASASRPAP